MSSCLASTCISAPNPNKYPPLKIALLGYRSHPRVGGQGIYLKYLSRALAELGHTVDVYSGPPYPELAPSVKLIKIPSLNLYESPNHIRALRWRHLLSYTDFFEWACMASGGFGEPYTFGRRIYKRLKKNDYDIIHDNQSLCYGLLNLQKRGHNIISTIHHPIHRDKEYALNEEKNVGMKKLIERWHSFLKMQEKVVPKLNHVLTVSSQSQQDIEYYFKRPLENTPVFFNGIDTNLFKPCLAHEQKQTHTLLTTSSSDQPLKGLRSLLLALSLVRKKQPNIRLKIIGKLKPNGRNAKLISKLKLEKNIQFMNNLSDETLAQAYRLATIVVCPSLYEGFGLPAAEALASGTATITSDGGALPEVVGDCGIVYPANNHHQLSKCILDLLNNSEKRHALEKVSRARALHHFCWHTLAKKLDHYYRDILSN